MRVRIANYEVSSDATCWQLNRVSIVTGEKVAGREVKPENVGKERLSNVGYFGTFRQALERLVDSYLQESDAQSLQQVWEKLDEIRQLIAALPEPQRETRASDDAD